MIDKMITLATERITEQMKSYKKGQAERRAGRLMVKLCEANPQAAELIAQDLTVKEMSLAVVTDKVRKAAKKQSQENHLAECEFDDEDYLEIICEFYGLGGDLHSVETTVKPAANPKKVVSFMDLL